MLSYYDDKRGSGVVRYTPSGKSHRIRYHNGVPYITFKRKTRVLYQGPLGLGGQIHIGSKNVHFRDVDCV